MKQSVGIIGYGNMGSAIAQQIKRTYEVWVFDKIEIAPAPQLFKINIAKSIPELVERSHGRIILAVKPQDIDTVLNEIKGREVKKIISIAAGIPVTYLEERLSSVHFVRVMPNLPIKVGEGVICVAKESLEPQERLLLGIFGSLPWCDLAGMERLGKIVAIPELMMDAATAVSGSGPGFLFALLETIPNADWENFAKKIFTPHLEEAALAIGFQKEIAHELAKGTAIGSLNLLRQSSLTPDSLRAQVTSKGGTTEAGLKLLQGKLENLTLAVKAALQKAGELSKKE